MHLYSILNLKESIGPLRVAFGLSGLKFRPLRVDFGRSGLDFGPLEVKFCPVWHLGFNILGLGGIIWASRNRLCPDFGGSTVQDWTFESRFWALGTQLWTSESRF